MKTNIGISDENRQAGLEYINPFADKYKDLGTSGFITGLPEAHEKTAWFSRSHLK